MLPHFSMHGGREQNRRACSEGDGRQWVTGQTVREFGDDVRGGGGNQEQVRTIGEIDVTGSPAFFFVIEARHHRIFGKRLQRQRRNEFSRILRHDDKNFVALFDEQTSQLSRFIRGDRSRDTKHDRFLPRRNAYHFSRAGLFKSAFGIFFHLRSSS